MKIVIDNCQGCLFISFMNRMETCTLYHKTVDCNLNKKASFCKVKHMEVIEDER